MGLVWDWCRGLRGEAVGVGLRGGQDVSRGCGVVGGDVGGVVRGRPVWLALGLRMVVMRLCLVLRWGGGLGAGVRGPGRWQMEAAGVRHRGWLGGGGWGVVHGPGCFGARSGGGARERRVGASRAGGGASGWGVGAWGWYGACLAGPGGVGSLGPRRRVRFSGPGRRVRLIGPGRRVSFGRAGYGTAVAGTPGCSVAFAGPGRGPSFSGEGERLFSPRRGDSVPSSERRAAWLPSLGQGAAFLSPGQGDSLPSLGRAASLPSLGQGAALLWPGQGDPLSSPGRDTGPFVAPGWCPTPCASPCG